MTDKWTDVNDKLPKYNTFFIAYYNSGNMAVLYFWAVLWDDLAFIDNDFITHWRPLPKPPIDKQGVLFK